MTYMDLHDYTDIIIDVYFVMFTVPVPRGLIRTIVCLGDRHYMEVTGHN